MNDYDLVCAAMWNADPSVSGADKFYDDDDDEPLGSWSEEADMWDEDAYLTAEMPAYYAPTWDDVLYILGEDE